jgi:hypothetical protein
MLGMMRSARGALRLAIRDPRSLLLTIRMSIWIVVTTIVAPFVSLPTLCRLAETRRRWSTTLPPEELARHVDRVFHVGLVRDGMCWKRAAVLRRYLQLNGIETAVVFGVRREDGKLAGHAWLEHEGVRFLERDAREYTVTFRHPSPHPRLHLAWTAKSVASAAIFVLFAAILIGVPLAKAGARRSERFGWHMFTANPQRVHFTLVMRDGSRQAVDLRRYVGHSRGELELQAVLPQHLCGVVPGVASVLITLPEVKQQRVHPCR